MDVKNICEEIWRIEEKYNLVDKKIQGVKIWQQIRLSFYYEIAQKIGIFDKPHRENINIKQKIKESINIIKNSFINNPFVGRKKVDFIIFDHERKVEIDNKYIDIYTENIIKQLDKYDLQIIERSYNGKHLTEKSKNRKYEDILKVNTAICKLFKINKLTSEEKEYLLMIQNEMNTIWNIELDLIKYVQNRLYSFNSRVKYYDRLIKKRKPKAIFLVVSYGKADIILAAKKNNVKVIELQHGVISKYHLGYSYPNCSVGVDYFPDYILAFGEYWSNLKFIPIEQDKIISYGFSYFNNKIRNIKNIDKKMKQVIFISQGVIGKELSKICLEFVKKNSEYNVIYKLHPGEFADWKDSYCDLVKAQNEYGVKVVENSKKSLYEYLNESEFCIGVFSTAIYEGLALGCKTILINFSGIEYMRELINEKIVLLANNATEICEIMNNGIFKKMDNDYFFCETMEIDELLKKCNINVENVKSEIRI